MDPGRLFNYGSRRLNRRSRPNSHLMLNGRDLDCPVGFWPIFSTKISLKQRLPMFYHHTLDTEQLFGDVQQSRVEFRTSRSHSQNRPRLLKFYLVFLWFWRMVKTQIAFGATNND